mgnify:CR=1 FL=1
MAKIVKFDSEARSAMLKGVDILANTVKVTLGRKQTTLDVRIANIGHQEADLVEIDASVHTIRGPKRFEEITVFCTSWVKHVPRRLVRIAPTPFRNCPVGIRIGQHLEPRPRTIELHGARQPTEMIAHVTWANGDCDDHDAPLNHICVGHSIESSERLADEDDTREQETHTIIVHHPIRHNWDQGS